MTQCRAKIMVGYANYVGDIKLRCTRDESHMDEYKDRVHHTWFDRLYWQEERHTATMTTAVDVQDSEVARAAEILSEPEEHKPPSFW